MMTKITGTLTLIAAVALLNAGPAQASLFSNGFETDAAASEYASGDFDPATDIPNENAENVIQVVNTSTNPNGDPSGNPQVKSGNNSLKFNGNSGNDPRFQVLPADTGVTTISFDLYLNPGDAIGADRLSEIFVDDPDSSIGVDVWALRIDENSSLIYESDTLGWVDSGIDLQMNTWNNFILQADAPAGKVELFLNNEKFNGNIYRGNGDSINELNFFSGNVSGTGAGMFLDNVAVHAGIIPLVPEPSTAILLGLGSSMLLRRRR